MDRSLMEDAWESTPNQAEFTGRSAGYVQKFLRALGTDYDFLFTERSARFVPNAKIYKQAMDRVIVTLQAEDIFVRFVRDRGDTEVLIAPANDDRGWLSAYGLCLLILLNGELNIQNSTKNSLQVSSIPDVLREHFSGFRTALSPERFESTRLDLQRMQRLRSIDALDLFNARSGSSFCEPRLLYVQRKFSGQQIGPRSIPRR